MSKIVGLHGQAVAQPGEPVADTIKVAEDILEMARSGEISGIAAVLVHRDETTSFQRHLIVTYRAIGAVHVMANELERLLLEAAS